MLKKTFTLFVASFMALSLFAADIASRITVSVSGNNNYELRIDGRRYTTSNSRLYLDDLRPGRHSIEVYEMHPRNRRNNRPVYASSFSVRPQYDLHIAIDRNGHVRINETRNSSRNDRGWNNRDDRDWNDRNDRDWNGRKDRDRGSERRERSRAMSDYDYSSLVQQVRRQWSASSKYNLVREAVQRDYFSSEQVYGLLQQVASGRERLDVAKLAYRNTVDKHNYSHVYRLFSRSEQRDLDNYIRNNQY